MRVVVACATSELSLMGVQLVFLSDRPRVLRSKSHRMKATRPVQEFWNCSTTSCNRRMVACPEPIIRNTHAEQ